MPGKFSSLLWGPVFARGFDRFNKGAEDAGLREKRRTLLARARGRTLEIGAGTGVNIGLYPTSEIERVLKPGGSLLFLEHVRATDPRAAQWQDRLERPWGWFGRGCHPNRDTLATIERSRLELVDVEHGRIARVPPILRPLIVGEARRPEPATHRSR